MLRTRNGRIRPWIILSLLVAIAPVLTGCYGNFQATKAIYKWNGEVSDEKVVRSVVMWGLLILPVYYIGGLADVFVLNPLEYWKGAKIELGSGTDAKSTTVALEPSANGRETVMTVSRDGAVLAKSTLVRTSDSEFEVRDTEGRLAGKMLRAPDGSLRLTDASGLTLRTITATELASARVQ